MKDDLMEAGVEVSQSLMDEMNRCVATLNGGLKLSLDRLLRERLNEVLGCEDWNPAEVMMRMVRRVSAADASETFTLDGRPILGLGPMKIETVESEGKVKLLVSHTYRKIWWNPK